MSRVGVGVRVRVRARARVVGRPSHGSAHLRCASRRGEKADNAHRRLVRGRGIARVRVGLLGQRLHLRRRVGSYRGDN